MPTSLAALRRETRAAANPAKAKLLSGFFKTGKGEYGEGDVFLGLMVPVTRAIAAKYHDLSLANIEKLLHSRFHEERVLAFLLLVRRFEKGSPAMRREAYAFYLEHAEYANNWDLVDLSAPNIVGGWLAGPPPRDGDARRLLTRLAASRNLWRRRIAIVATAAFIRTGSFTHTFRIADLLMNDSHDLIHKATGWMLREVGKRDKAALVRYLKPRYKTMPRTMLRYAIEKFSPIERQRYLKGRA